MVSANVTETSSTLEFLNGQQEQVWKYKFSSFLFFLNQWKWISVIFCVHLPEFGICSPLQYSRRLVRCQDQAESVGKRF